MVEVISGLVIVGFLIGLIYLLDALTLKIGAVRPAAAVSYAVTTTLIVLGMFTLVSGSTSDRGSVAGGIGLLAAGIVAAVALWQPGRRFIASYLPIRPNERRAWLGLVLLLWLAIYRLVTFSDAGEVDVGEVSITEAFIQTVALVGIAVAAVGFLTRRSLRETARRLGLTRFSIGPVAVGFILVIPMALVGVFSIQLVDFLSPGALERLGETVSDITGDQTSLQYGLALGIAAAVGEETLFRGAIQPKYGLVFTALLFAVLHIQYEVLLLLASLFPVGLVLGLERKYFGTVACVITHALYNTLAVVLS